jgi:HEAT repeat protein
MLIVAVAGVAAAAPRAAKGVDGLRSTSAAERIKACEALRAAPPKGAEGFAALTALDRLLSSERDAEVRRAGALAYGAVANDLFASAQGDPKVCEHVFGELRSAVGRDWRATIPLAQQLVEALLERSDGKFPLVSDLARAVDDQGLDVLVRAVGDPTAPRDVAQRVRHALRDSARDVAPLVIRMLASGDVAVRRLGAETAAATDDAQVAKALVPMLKDADVDVRANAAWSLMMLIGNVRPVGKERRLDNLRGISKEKEPELVKALATAKGDRDLAVAYYAAKGEERLDDAAPPPFQDPPGVTRGAPNPALLAILSDQSQSALSRERVLMLIKAYLIPAKPAVLVPWLADKDWRVRRAAAYAIDVQAQIGWGPADTAVALAAFGPLMRTEQVDAVVTAASQYCAAADHDRLALESSVRALGQKGPAAAGAVGILREALGHWNAMIREDAAKALGAVKPADPQVVRALTEALADQDSRVVAAAAKSLENAGPAAGAAALSALVEHAWRLQDVPNARDDQRAVIESFTRIYSALPADRRVRVDLPKDLSQAIARGAGSRYAKAEQFGRALESAGVKVDGLPAAPAAKGGGAKRLR